MAYQFLQEAAKKRTESIVVEAAVDTTGGVKAELPVELVDLLLRNVYDGDEWESEGQVRTPGALINISISTTPTGSVWIFSGLDDHL